MDVTQKCILITRVSMELTSLIGCSTTRFDHTKRPELTVYYRLSQHEASRPQAYRTLVHGLRHDLANVPDELLAGYKAEPHVVRKAIGHVLRLDGSREFAEVRRQTAFQSLGIFQSNETLRRRFGLQFLLMEPLSETIVEGMAKREAA